MRWLHRASNLATYHGRDWRRLWRYCHCGLRAHSRLDDESLTTHPPSVPPPVAPHNTGPHWSDPIDHVASSGRRRQSPNRGGRW